MNPIPPIKPITIVESGPIEKPHTSPRIKEIQSEEKKVQEEIETDKKGVKRRNTV